MQAMIRVLIFGPGRAGKSTLATKPDAINAIAVIELDKHFWGKDLDSTPNEAWVAMLLANAPAITRTARVLAVAMEMATRELATFAGGNRASRTRQWFGSSAANVM
jgi:hypothetical protein